jgi:hypothetical protein
MGYGKLTTDQEDALRPFLKDVIVHDLGAGNLLLSSELVRLGAERVIALDKEPYRASPPAKVQPVACYFHEYNGTGTIHTAFVSWPLNTYMDGFTKLTEKAQFLIYLGKNSDGLMCGFEKFWDLVREREVLAHVPHQTNTLIVYGPERRLRPILPEEIAAIYKERMWTYSELHAS